MSFKKYCLKSILILALLEGLLFQDYSYAATEPAADQQIISAVLKSLARAFIATADIEKINQLFKAPRGEFLVAAIYEIKIGPQVARQGPAPKIIPEIKILNAIFVTFLRRFQR